ncbi:MAG: glycosyltransferase family 4 protein [Planctomycetota bacterium]
MTGDRLLVVGNNQVDYNSERNFHALPFTKVRTKKTSDVLKPVNHALQKGLRRKSELVQYLHCDLGLNGCDVLHFFNSLSLGRTPWITTVESVSPRWNHSSHFGVRLMARDTCRNLLMMSGNGMQIQSHLLDGFPAERDAIAGKMRVLHPAQAPLIDSIEDKPVDSRYITAMLVGADFFRKGGLELLRAADRLLRRDAPLRLVIVSSMKTADYASRAGADHLNEARELIERHPKAIVHHHRLPNEAVLDLFRCSDIGLLPTYDETYGYSVLEAQAAGCATITTNMRALPEINTANTGWTIDVPVGDFGVATYQSDTGRARLSVSIEEGLEAALDEACKDPPSVRTRGSRALTRIREDHDPHQHARLLETIYFESVGLPDPHAGVTE